MDTSHLESHCQYHLDLGPVTAKGQPGHKLLHIDANSTIYRYMERFHWLLLKAVCLGSQTEMTVGSTTRANADYIVEAICKESVVEILHSGKKILGLELLVSLPVSM